MSFASWPGHHENMLYNFDSLKPHICIAKHGVYRGIHYFFNSPQKHRSASNEYSQSMFWAEIHVWKISEFVYLNIFIFLDVKISVYLNKHVFVMAIINLQWFELSMSRANFYDPKDVRIIEIRLYKVWLIKPIPVFWLHYIKNLCNAEAMFPNNIWWKGVFMIFLFLPFISFFLYLC